MTTERYDIVVIGAGVAGAAFAAHVAHPSRRVLLVERSQWPRPKVCGCCLNGAAVAPLQRLGLGDALYNAGIQLNRVRILARSKTATLAVPSGIALSRLVLDELIVSRAIESGAEFLPGVAATITASKSAQQWSVQLRTAHGVRTISANVVIAADGLCGSSLNGLDLFQPIVSPRAWFGVGGTLTGVTEESCGNGAISMHVATHGYAGLVRLGSRTVNLAAAMNPDWTREVGGPAQAIAAIINEARGEGASFDLGSAQLRGTGLLTRRRPIVSRPGLLVIGDASGYIEPFTGEGMAWALAGAEAAAGMVNAGLNASELATSWAHWHTSQLRSRQRTCTLIRELLRRPRLVSGVLSAIGTIPAAAQVASAIVRRIERPYGRSAIARTQGAVA